MSEQYINSISTISDVEELESVPLETAIPFKTTWELLSFAADNYAKKPALSFLMSGDYNEDPVTWTYFELVSEIGKTANAFHKLGVNGNSCVSIILPNLPEYHFAVWGAQCAGIANPINPMLEPSHMAGIISAAGSEVVVTVAPTPGSDIYEKAVEAANSVSRVKHIILVDPVTYPPCEPADQATRIREREAIAPGGPEILDFSDIVAVAAKDGLAFHRQIAPSDTASFFHTGGTTGVPKLAAHSHLNEVFESWIINKMRGTKPDEVIFCGLPLFHVNGAIVTGLAAFASGAHVILATSLGYRTPAVMENFWKLVEKYRINTFSCVPTILSTLMEQQVDADVSSLEYAICGAAPMSPSVFKRFEEATGVKIIEGYGLTEGTCVSSLNPVVGERKVGSVGLRIPYQDLQVAEIGADGNILRFCEPGEPGEIVIRGPNVFPGYTDSESNKGVLVEDGWLITGDIGRIDEDHYLWLTGREKDLIIRGGHNIDPAIIENALMGHRAVASAAAVGQIDTYAGELPVAYVTIKPDSAVTTDELLDFARDRIAERAAVPVRIEIVGKIPVTAVGKTFKPHLRAMSAEFVLRQVFDSNSISIESLNVFQDTKTGLSVEITVANPEHLQRAQELLGKYAIRSKVQ